MIKLIKPYLTYEEVEDQFKQVFATGMFTKFVFVKKFVDDIKHYVQAKHTFLTTSATTALSVSLKVLNVQPGDEVIVADFSFPATVNVVEDLGAVPIFADVDLRTFNMLPDALEQKITSKTKAVIFVDALGNPSGIHNIKAICEKKHIPLIEDAACAIGSSEYGEKCGSIADLTCFSFHPRKLLTTGEGGAITTCHDAYADFLAVKLNHGAVMCGNKQDFIDYGYNYRLPELQAIMGSCQVKKLDDIVKTRNAIRQEYVQRLADLDFCPQQVTEEVVHNIQSLVFIVPDTVNRDTLIAYLKEHDIETTLGTYCLSNTTYYRNKYNQVQPNAKFLEEKTITLPCYDGVNVEAVCQAIRAYCLYDK